MLSRIEREQYLVGHIPYRLQSLRICHIACEQLMLTPHPEFHLELRISEALVLDDSNLLLTNPILESGLLYCRVLLEFLGIHRDRRTGQLVQTQQATASDDVSITDFGLPKMTVCQAVTGTSYAASSEIDTALRCVLENANKVVAHLTSGPTLPATYPFLKLACRVVIDLVQHHLYDPLDEDSIVPAITDHCAAN
jgi:hypothetical protein